MRPKYIVFENHLKEDEVSEDTRYSTFSTLQEALHYLKQEATLPAILYRYIDNKYKILIKELL